MQKTKSDLKFNRKGGLFLYEIKIDTQKTGQKNETATQKNC